MAGFGSKFGRVAAGCLAMTAGAPCVAQTYSPTLSNITFGTLTTTSIYTDQINRQNTCSFTGTAPITYSVTGSGSGSGMAFTVTNGTSAVPYQVQWAQTSGASSGTPLVANVPLTNQRTAGILSGLTCALGVTNATLIVVVASADLLQATKGTYNGTLSILLSVQ